MRKFAAKYGEFFSYIGGYPNNIITIKCNRCGAIRKRDRREIFKERENIVCRECLNNMHGIKRICQNCGRLYDKRGQNQKVCDECRADIERAKGRARRRLREARSMNNGKIDYSITLAGLIERDNHICQLCGREVNETDYIFKGDIFIAGNDYPSIDHIKPLSKGGVHQWSNVQLAHRLCNSIKHNKENK